MLSFTLAAVGITPIPHVFPHTVSCETCGGIVMIDLDGAQDGFWLSWRQCKLQGNLVEFAAHRWKCTNDDACARLRETLPVGVSTWLERQLSDAKTRLQTLQLFDDEQTRALVDDDEWCGPFVPCALRVRTQKPA
jgi:hypothetical protein